MPKEVAEASPEGGTLSEVVGPARTGFVEYREDQHVRLQRFADYTARDDAPNYQTGNKIAYPDELLFWIVPEASTRVAGLEAGRVQRGDRLYHHHHAAHRARDPRVGYWK